MTHAPGPAGAGMLRTWRFSSVPCWSAGGRSSTPSPTVRARSARRAGGRDRRRRGGRRQDPAGRGGRRASRAQPARRVLVGGCVELGARRAVRAARRGAAPARATEPPRSSTRCSARARPELARLVPELDPDRARRSTAERAQPAQLLELVLGASAASAPTGRWCWSSRTSTGPTARRSTWSRLLVRGLRDGRVLLVLTYRSDELHRGHPLRPLLAGWERLRTVGGWSSQRLRARRGGRAARGRSSAEPPSRAGRHVFARSEGNPFLVEEVARRVRAGADPAAWRRRCATCCSRAPSSSPSRPARAAGSPAAGSVGARTLLAAVAALDEARSTPRCERRSSTTCSSSTRRRGYAFRHALARDAVYEDLLPGERVRLHAAYGEALERARARRDGARGRRDARPPLVRGARPPPRARALVAGGAGRRRGFAPAEAQRHLERALALGRRCPTPASAPGSTSSRCSSSRPRPRYAAGALDRARRCSTRPWRRSAPTATRSGARCCSNNARRRSARSSAAQTDGVADLEAAVRTAAGGSTLRRPRERARLARVTGSFLHLDDLDGARAAAERAVAAASAAGARARGGRRPDHARLC